MAKAPQELTVDGETFEITRRGKTVDVRWTSGGDTAYGFSSTTAGGMTEAGLIESIRMFLAQVRSLG